MSKESINIFIDHMMQKDYKVSLDKGKALFYQEDYKQSIIYFEQACLRLNFFTDQYYDLEFLDLSLHYAQALKYLTIKNLDDLVWVDYYEESLIYFELCLQILEQNTNKFVSLNEKMILKHNVSKILLDRAQLHSQVEEYEDANDDIDEALSLLHDLNKPCIELLSAHFMMAQNYKNDMINLNFYAYQEAKDNYNKVSELIDILKNTANQNELQQLQKIEFQIDTERQELQQQYEKIKKSMLKKTKSQQYQEKGIFQTQFERPKLNQEPKSIGIYKSGRIIKY